ncbi:glutathione peroxidase 2-like [Tachypleus tridentatus]|uniref:glutathione peroxidase 2-like n=1 Tax=Tachypleus tridentatus TaxID=6853 RepID=UPI003FD1ED56
MNELISKYGDKLVVLGFPCNQFGHQENGKGEEIMNTLRYVRPGNGFQTKITLFEKIDVNGENSHPVFQFLRQSLPTPHDDPLSFVKNPQCIIWSPVTRGDICWNFEKFLIDKNGQPFRRYGPRYPTINLDSDIAELISK